jgi:hypothetical protein
MDSTRSSVYARSAEIKKIDESIKLAEQFAPEFEAMNRWFSDLSSERRAESARVALDLDQKIRDLGVLRVRDAFNVWAKSYGTTNWRSSGRNSGGAITALAQQLGYLTSRLPAAESAAVAFIEAQRNRSIPVLFADCKVVTYSDRLTSLQERKTATSTALNLRTVYNDANPDGMGAPTSAEAEGFLRGIASQVDAMVHEAFGEGHGGSGHSFIDDLGIKGIVDAAVKEIKSEIAAILPAAGLAAASATFVFHTVNLVMQSIVADTLIDLEKRLEVGDSRVALASIREWQLIAIAKTTSSLVRSGVNVGAHAAAFASCGLGVPAQVAVAAGNAILALAAVIGEMGMQYKQKKALEKYLSKPDLGREIFAQSYLASAYYLINTPDSHIALQLVRIGGPGWQADVERMKKGGELSTIVELAAKIIDESKYRIRKSDMSKLRETAGQSAMSKMKDKFRGERVVAS